VICIDYYFDSAMEKVTGQAVALWMLLAFIAGIITYLLYRRGKMKASTAIIIPILVFFLSFVLTITIIERVPRRTLRYNLELFWTVKGVLSGRTYLFWEIFWNVVLFIPLGLMVSALLKHPWMAVLIGVLMSAAIELTQLLTRRGMFEFDDIIYNSVGAAAGYLLYLMLRRIGRCEDEQSD
jgi:glycopeptide antibiotics resistance protein